MLFKKLVGKLLGSPSCVLCGFKTQTARNICCACQKNLPILPHTCPRCAQVLPNLTLLSCGACLKNPPPFAYTFACFPYAPPIIHLIIKLKFQHKLSYARALGELLTEAIQTRWYAQKPLPDLIITIPLHAKRLRERGFNQALEIVRPAAKTLGLRIDNHIAYRIKSTAAQSGLVSAERKRNISQAFEVRRDLTGLHIAVVDDVITTGHTMQEFCRTLKQNGAARIDVWCCARRI